MRTCGSADFFDLKMTKPNYNPNTGSNSNPNASPSFHPNRFQNPQIRTSTFYQWPSGTGVTLGFIPNSSQPDKSGQSLILI